VASLQGRWNADIQYIGDYSGEASLNFAIKTGEKQDIFFTIMSDRAVSSPIQYENADSRKIPMIQAGYEIETDTIVASVGGVVDKYNKKDADYLGYMGFANVVYKMGKIDELENGSMAFGISGVYGVNVSKFAGMDPADMECITLHAYGTFAPTPVAKYADDSTVYGAIAFVAGSFWTGGLISADVRYSQATLSDSDPYTAIKAEGGVTQYFAKNFYVMVAGGYESYSVVAGDKGADAAWGYEATVEAGYKF
ncbi:MAG: hypothetical protein ACRCUT_05025, partial [Spirochaetota bacterium]